LGQPGTRLRRCQRHRTQTTSTSRTRTRKSKGSSLNESRERKLLRIDNREPRARFSSDIIVG
jgi:hypothetical protein